MTIRSCIAISGLLLALVLTSTCSSPGKSVAVPEELTKKDQTAEQDQGIIKLSEEEIRSSGIIASEVVEGQVSDTVLIQGRVIPRSGQQATVIPPFPGRLLAGPNFPRVGDLVPQGRVLATLEQELSASEVTVASEKQIDLNSQIKQTESEVNQKTKDFERAHILYEGGVIALKQLQQAETDLGIARARLEMAVGAKARYDDLQSTSPSSPRRISLKAPIAGTITTVNTAPNQQVDNTKNLFEIVSLDVVWIEAQVVEDYLANVKRSHQVEISARAVPGRTFRGRFVSFTHLVDPINKTEGVIFEVANSGNVLALGMNVEVRLPSGTVSTGPLVPTSALIEEQGHSVVFVERKPGEYERREVKTGSRQGDKVIIISGLAKNDKVVTTGAQLLVSASEKKDEDQEKEEH